MKAELVELEGKYYGTEVVIMDDDPNFQNGMIQIWVMGNWKASSRELESLRDNITDELEREPTDKEWEDEQADYFCDSHYETETSLEIATKLVEAINDER